MFRRILIAVGVVFLSTFPSAIKADDRNTEASAARSNTSVERNRDCRLRHYENTATLSNCVRVGRAPNNGYYSPEEYEQFNRNNRVMLPAYTCRLYKVVDKYNMVYYKEICQ